ncbi:hypothetical protein PAXRUDRAFT_800539 [Paxillus rubicundulus Ve08.2h10]|uniref:Uncharacterized protein n=1 Tax=Paxillus rubicundulus Ve08.2h10 TaxID=930991 RepID=A0A0D0D589_9AGAM|nr:hypothetical protein PAXRUDRAFT_800539 [Paxillus rubicundulus Ve08.2h10]
MVNKPPSTGLAHTPQLPSLSPPIAPWPSPMGCPAPYEPSLSCPPSAHLSHMHLPQLAHSSHPGAPPLAHPTPPGFNPLAHPLPPITFQCYIFYIVTLSCLTLGWPIHYGQLHSWAHP